MLLRRLQFALFLSFYLCGISTAQVPNQTVQWAGSAVPEAAVKHGSNATLELSAKIQEGWHVYALTQPSGGPTPLRVTLDENAVVQIAGATSSTAPERKHDPSFDLETQFYTQSFAVHVPVRVKANAAAGRQLIPVSIRFQTCSDRECQPPRTVHLSVPMNVLPGS
jgi:hypothetical protein